MSLANTAIKLGKRHVIMNSYKKCHDGEQNWFFSPNPKLDMATQRPSSFQDWKDWFNFSQRQRMTLASLAGFHYSGSSIIKNNRDLAKLKNAYMQWPLGLYSIFWKGEGKKLWFCNIFVGDSIYMHNGQNFTSTNHHYYDPKQIQKGQSFLQKRNSYKEVKAGDVVVFTRGGEGYHVEIITRIERPFFFDDGFCSVGAGRNDSDETGTVKCDSDEFYLGVDRELEDESHIYYYLP